MSKVKICNACGKTIIKGVDDYGMFWIRSHGIYIYYCSDACYEILSTPDLDKYLVAAQNQTSE